MLLHPFLLTQISLFLETFEDHFSVHAVTYAATVFIVYNIGFFAFLP